MVFLDNELVRGKDNCAQVGLSYTTESFCFPGLQSWLLITHLMVSCLDSLNINRKQWFYFYTGTYSSPGLCASSEYVWQSYLSSFLCTHSTYKHIISLLHALHMSEETVLVQGPVLTLITWKPDLLVHRQNVSCCVAHIGDDAHAQFTNIIALQFTNILCWFTAKYGIPGV